MKNTKIKIVKDLNPRFLAGWQSLWEESESAHFFNSPSWLLICLKTFNIKNYWIFTGYQGGELKAVSPLVKSRKLGIPVFMSPGERYLEKSTLLISDDDSALIDHLFSEIVKHGNIFFSEVNEQLVSQLIKSKTEYLITAISINPYLELKLDPHRYLSKKQKSKIFNKIKKAEDNLNHGHYTANLEKHLKTVFEVEGKSVKRLKGKDIFSKAKAKEIYGDLIKIAPKNVLIDILYYHNIPIVTMFGLIYKRKYLAFHTAYVNEFKQLIPGKMLLYKLLMKLREANFSLVDFSRGHNVFKKEFTPLYSLQYDVYYSKNLMVRIWWEGINSLRRLKQVLIRNKYSLDGYYLFRKYEDIRKKEFIKRIIPKLI